MPGDSAQVVIVGGGAMGASTAFHLAQLGVTDVVLCERGTLGSGSTSKSAGGIRAQFADEIKIRIALLSLLEVRNFQERVGGDIDFRETAYLFLLDSDDDVRRFRDAVGLQGSLGVLSTQLTLEEVLELVPQLNTEGLSGATYCPRDGFATPEAVVRGYAQAAAEKGVRIRQGVDVTRIPVLGNKILGVDTTEGRIKTDTVVCAAGVWSKDVAALVGMTLPVEGEVRWMHYTPESPGLPEVVPLTVDFSTGFYFHRAEPALV